MSPAHPYHNPSPPFIHSPLLSPIRLLSGAVSITATRDSGGGHGERAHTLTASDPLQKAEIYARKDTQGQLWGPGVGRKELEACI